MSGLSEGQRQALAEALRTARVEDGSPTPLFTEDDAHHAAFMVAPLVAGWIAEERAGAVNAVAAIADDYAALIEAARDDDDPATVTVRADRVVNRLRAATARGGA